MKFKKHDKKTAITTRQKSIKKNKTNKIYYTKFKLKIPYKNL